MMLMQLTHGPWESLLLTSAALSCCCSCCCLLMMISFVVEETYYNNSKLLTCADCRYLYQYIVTDFLLLTVADYFMTMQAATGAILHDLNT